MSIETFHRSLASHEHDDEQLRALARLRDQPDAVRAGSGDEADWNPWT